MRGRREKTNKHRWGGEGHISKGSVRGSNKTHAKVTTLRPCREKCYWFKIVTKQEMREVERPMMGYRVISWKRKRNLTT